jgi:hypothetical protein
MPAYKRGDVLLVYYPFSDDPYKTKLRPAILLEDAVDDHFVMKCTKTDKSKYGECIYIAPNSKEYEQMGLWEPTFISSSETVVLEKCFIDSWLGTCPEYLIDKISDILGI